MLGSWKLLFFEFCRAGARVSIGPRSWEAFCLALGLEVLAGACIVGAVRHYKAPAPFQLQQTAHERAARRAAPALCAPVSHYTASRRTYGWGFGGPPSQDVLIKELQRAPGQASKRQ